MRVYDRKLRCAEPSLRSIADACRSVADVPVRVVVTSNRGEGCELEADFVDLEGFRWEGATDLFALRKRGHENVRELNVVLIVPTGIGCELGGHEGDANPVGRLLASACDTLITHPNVVNATDYNEMTENTLYVEGSTLTRLLLGQVGLERVRSNRVLLVVERGDDHYTAEMINAASSARTTLGMSVDVLLVENAGRATIGLSECGRAVGEIRGMEALFLADRYADYDAVALATRIDRDTPWSRAYFSASRLDGPTVNPTGGIEAMLTHSLTEHFRKPFAHAPAPEEGLHKSGVLDPRLAAFTGSVRHIHCCLKGLHKSPRIVEPGRGLGVEDVSCLVVPDGCIGLPVLACLEQGIPVIAVADRSIMANDLERLPFRSDRLFRARNYLEAVGLIHMLKSGLALDAITRPIGATRVSVPE
jgi:Protein of unknown function (DUF3326)